MPVGIKGMVEYTVECFKEENNKIFAKEFYIATLMPRGDLPTYIEYEWKNESLKHKFFKRLTA